MPAQLRELNSSGHTLMLSRILTFVRNRWHPLRELRKLAVFRRLQNRFDFTIYRRVPGTGLRVAMKLVRDASWIANPEALEPEVRAAFSLVLNLMKPSVFWDVGADVGYYSWLVRQHPSIRQVVLFEPDPTNFQLITNTISKNGLSECYPMNLALTDRNGEAPFLVDRASGAAGSLRSVSNADNPLCLQHQYRMSETISIRTATIDSLISEGLPLPELIKIDVEGAEHLVLTGAEICLTRSRPTLIVETSNAEVLRKLSNKGYSIFRIDAGNLLFACAESGVDLAAVERAFGLVEPPGIKRS
jgi:FkbM family methyltransferase